MSGDSTSIHIVAVFVTKETANALLQYVKDMDARCYILPAFESTAWSVMAVSFLSLLAVSAVLLTFFFVRRYRIRHFSSRFLLNREARGLSSREVKALPAVTYKSCDTSGTDVCAICLESYEVGEKLRVLPCHHDFHALCVDKWLTTRRAFCPICKRDARFKSTVGPPSEQTPLLSAISSSPLPTFATSIPIPTSVPLDTHTGSSPFSAAPALSPSRWQEVPYMLPQVADGHSNISETSNAQGMLSCSPETTSHQWSTQNCKMTLTGKIYCSLPMYTASSESLDSLNSSSQGSDFC